MFKKFIFASIFMSLLTLSASADDGGNGDGDGDAAAAADASGEAAVAAIGDFASAESNMNAVVAEADLGIVGPDTLAQAQETMNEAAVNAVLALTDFAAAVSLATGMNFGQIQAAIDAAMAGIDSNDIESADTSNAIFGSGREISNIVTNTPNIPITPIQLVAQPGSSSAPQFCSVKGRDGSVTLVALTKSKIFYTPNYNPKYGTSCKAQSRHCSIVNGVPFLSGTYRDSSDVCDE